MNDSSKFNALVALIGSISKRLLEIEEELKKRHDLSIQASVKGDIAGAMELLQADPILTERYNSLLGRYNEVASKIRAMGYNVNPWGGSLK